MNTYFTKIIFSFVALTLSCVLSFAQTELSGIINAYTPVLGIDYCNAAIQVDDTEGFEIGMSVILIQMQGAEIRNENNVNFGTITDMRSAGLYEKGEILFISNDTVFLKNSLIHEYNIGHGLQLVSMPSYQSARVANTLQAKPWDGTTGGILAFEVTGTLVLEGTIDVSQAGFRGGALTTYNIDCTGGFNNANAFVYAAGDWRGAGKGEGIAAYISGKENGRGALANGGGGGNDHNSGGGGGANITAGGNGGRRETSFITLDCKGDNPGLRGNALPTEGGRIFLGGGGGAGHSNNNSPSPGMSGGGIVIIEAGLIMSNNAAIDASGGSAQTADGDGGGGGGAGGTVILLSNQLQGRLLVNLTGGNGGSTNNNNREDCFGPGGGGSGGYFLTDINSADLNVQLTGGVAGKTLNSTSSCRGSSNGGEDGENGVQEQIRALTEGTTAALPPAVLSQPGILTACMEENAVLSVGVQGGGITYQWQIDRGNGFENLINNITYQGVETETLTIINVSENMASHQFRLILSTECFDDVISDPIGLDIQTPPDINVEYVLDGRTIIFTNSTSGASSFRWDFGDGRTSTATNPTYTYSQDGTYTVLLEIESDCGSVTKEFVISILSPPEAGFTAVQRTGCAPLTVDFTSTAGGTISSILWLFPGGEPATSTQANPSVTYPTGGNYPVTLIVSNAAGADSLRRTDYVQVQHLPMPSFNVEFVDHLTVTFANTTLYGQSYEWDFGDGTNSGMNNPVHTYNTDGSYTVTLIAFNECGSQTFTKAVAAGSPPTPLFTSDRAIGCAPLTVKFVDRSVGVVENWFWSFPGGDPATSTLQNPIVRYEQGGTYPVSLTVGNSVDSITLTLEDFIQVNPRPVAEFEYEIIEAGLISFTNLSQNATQYSWNFGDGSTSTEENPTHEFTRNGFFSVTLNALNGSCATSTSQSILIMVTDVERIGNSPKLSIFPNPTANYLNIALEGQVSKSIQLRLLSPNGALLQTTQFSGNQHTIDMHDLPQGLYLLQLIGEDWQVIQRVVKR